MALAGVQHRRDDRTDLRLLLPGNPHLYGRHSAPAVDADQAPVHRSDPNTEGILPGAATTLSGDLGGILVGFVLPYSMVFGGFVSSILSQLVANPILQRNGLLPTWHPGANAIFTTMATSLDVWMSVGIGLSIAVAIIGIAMAGSILRQYLRRA